MNLLTLLNQNEVFEELANVRMGEIQNLSKPTNFNNLIYHFKVKVIQKILFVLKVSI